jgi:hypothetical protein
MLFEVVIQYRLPNMIREILRLLTPLNILITQTIEEQRTVNINILTNIVILRSKPRIDNGMRGILLLLFGLLPQKANIDLKILDAAFNGLIDLQLKLLQYGFVQGQLLGTLFVPDFELGVVLAFPGEVVLDELPQFGLASGGVFADGGLGFVAGGFWEAGWLGRYLVCDGWFIGGLRDRVGGLLFWLRLELEGWFDCAFWAG